MGYSESVLGYAIGVVLQRQRVGCVGVFGDLG